MIKNEKLIEELNDLILINNDRIEKYKRVLKNSSSSEDQFFLKKMINQGTLFTDELADEIKNKSRGFNRKSVVRPGKIYKTWEDLKFSISEKNSLEIITSTEDAIQKIYQKALSPDVYIPSDIIHLIIIQKAKLKESYHAFKNSFNLNLVEP